MPKILRAFLFWTLILGACAPIIPATGVAPQNAPPTVPTGTVVPVATTQFPDSPALPIPRFTRTLETPSTAESPIALTTAAPSNPQECGYQWAQQDLPELSSSFQQSIQALQPEAKARAFAFGENCVHADETATFLAMETDFDVNLQVTDLTDTAVLGGWIVSVMQIIEKIPSDQLAGPQPGRVMMVFEQGSERGALTFYINRYRDLPAGLSNAEIYQALQIP